MTPQPAGEPTHAYCTTGLNELAAEKVKAKERLMQGFPRRTLIHIHPAGSGDACKGKAHLLYRISGEEVNWFTGPPTAADIARYP